MRKSDPPSEWSDNIGKLAAELMTYAMRNLPLQHADAQDLVAEVLLLMHSHKADIQNPYAYARATLRRQAYRLIKRRRYLEDRIKLEAAKVAQGKDAQGKDLEPEARAYHQELKRAFYSAFVRVLSPTERMALFLRGNGLSLRQIGQELELDKWQVRRTLDDVRGKLVASLGKHPELVRLLLKMLPSPLDR